MSKVAPRLTAVTALLEPPPKNPEPVTVIVLVTRLELVLKLRFETVGIGAVTVNSEAAVDALVAPVVFATMYQVPKGTPTGMIAPVIELSLVTV